MYTYLRNEVQPSRIVAVMDAPEVLKLLSSGRHDGAFLPEIQGHYLAEKLKLSNLKKVEASIPSKMFCFAVSQGNPELLYQLNEGLNVLKATGDYQRIYEKWFGVYDGSLTGRILRFILFFLIPLLVLLGISFLWSWSLRRQVKRKTSELQQELHERKKAEKALGESEERFRTMADFTYDWEYWAGPDGEYIYVSPSCERVTGYSPDDFKKDPKLLEKITHPEDLASFSRHIAEISEKSGAQYAEFRIITRDGKERWIGHVCQPVLNDEGVVLGRRSSNQDITGQKQVEEEKERLGLRLLEAQKTEAIATLAGGIAHEFNNALVGISGNIQLLQMGLNDQKDISKYLGRMNESSSRMANLTSQLLAYARGGKYQPEKISLASFVEETLPLIRHLFGPLVQVETEVLCDDPFVDVDRTQMQMVLSAVMVNAAEAMGKEGCIKVVIGKEKIGKKAAKIDSALKSGAYVCLAIEDNGKGMDEDTKNRIFDPFFTTKFQGRGLGMSAVYGIVNNHNGWIRVDSELGKGTTVRIFLPAAEVEVKKEEAPKTEPSTGTGTVLLIEDEENVMEVSRNMLERLGYRVIAAKTGKEAIDIATTYDGAMDLAILDIVLPDMWGNELYPLLKKARPHMKVIVCSGYSIDSPAQEILNAGAQGFIQKPFSLAPLSAKLKETLDDRSTRQTH